MLILKNPLLVAFETIAKVGTVHGAARELGVTQTALTLRLKNLEQELSITLFLRSRKGMSLTPEGHALLQLCQGQKELEGQFISHISGNDRREVSLTIVGPTSAVSSYVVDQCLPLYKKFSFLDLNFQADDHSNLIELVKKGMADMAIVHPSLVPNEMDSKMMKPQKYLLLGPASWKGRKMAEILENERIIDFYENDETTKKYLKEFKLDKLIKRQRQFANNNEVLLKMISAGVGFGTIAETIAKPLIESGKMIALNQARTIEEPLALTWYPRPAKQAYFEELIKSIK
jgi:LysR family transcriptional regulator (chromosome initiation inhibitor)